MSGWYSEGDITRYWGKVSVNGTDECWPWSASANSKGYGRIGIGGRAGGTKLAHRVGLELKLGRPLLDGMKALHTCDNPPCQNPSHLFEGTQADNMADMSRKGRRKPIARRFGERHHASALRDADIIAIRQSYSDRKQNQYELAKIYGVSQHTICSIVNRKSWRHI